MKWYVIKVVSGKEKKMKEAIESELKLNKNESIISKILIPSEKAIQIRNGKKINIEKNFFPGYILIECESINEVEANVKNIKGVGSVLKQPLSDSEVNRILGRIEKKDSGEIYMKGEKVKITDGPFSSFIGDIQEIDFEKQTAKVGVLIFGREVLLDLTFLQIEKEQ